MVAKAEKTVLQERVERAGAIANELKRKNGRGAKRKGSRFVNGNITREGDCWDVRRVHPAIGACVAL